MGATHTDWEWYNPIMEAGLGTPEMGSSNQAEGIRESFLEETASELGFDR